MIKYTLDRFENGFAVIETEQSGNITMINVMSEFVSQDAKEGDILIKTGEYYISDKKATCEKRNFLYNKLRKLK